MPKREARDGKPKIDLCEVERVHSVRAIPTQSPPYYSDPIFELRVAVQCKHWKTWNVGVAKARELLGAMAAAGIPRGILVTTSGYSGAAKTFADNNNIQIMNQTDVLRLLDSVDARHHPEFQHHLNDTQKFCPKCEKQMVLRTAKTGINRGSKFWGCSAYPGCHFTMPLD